jgi:hypothetical protein
VTEFLISAEDGEYLVSPSGKGGALNDHVGKAVTVVGTLETDEQGIEVLHVLEVRPH